MTNIELKNNSIKATGHIGEKGNSLLCACVSVLMWGLVNALQHEGVDPIVNCKDGYQEVIYNGKKDVKRLFDAYSNNLLSLSEEYPEDITFEIKN